MKHLTASIAKFLIGCVCFAAQLGVADLHATSCYGQTSGKVSVDILEEESGEPLICRVEIVDPKGRFQKARGGLFQNGWNLVESPLDYRGRPGDYTYSVHHGPEFSAASGGFTLDRQSEGIDVLQLPRHADLASEGWFGGDLLSWINPTQAMKWLPAEALKMTVAVSDEFVAANASSNSPEEDSANLSGYRVDDGTHWVESKSYLDSRPGSGLLLHHWMPPAEVPSDVPSSRLLLMAKEHAGDSRFPVHAEIQKLWARDVPIWLASDRIDSVQLLSDHLTYDGKNVGNFQPLIEPEGRYRGPTAPGRIVEKLYWQLLETGLRIPPTAGSGFGRGRTPLGYNRVYAHLDSSTPDSWWHAVRAGNTFVTNGPLLRARVNGEVPGQIFVAPAGGSVSLTISLTLTVSDPVEYLDVVFNGRTLYQARLDEYAKQGGKIPLQTISESGWMVIRVVTERDFTYRMATTAPYYIEIGEQPRISKSAVEFFVEWLEAAASQIEALEPSAKKAAEPYVAAARKFWQARLAMANSD